MTLRLCNRTLERIPDTVQQPTYQAAQLSAGIVHIGVGNFHRAHQGVYLNTLFNLGLDHDWAIIGAGVMSADTMRYTQLQKQDWLTTVVETAANESKAIISGSMIDFFPPAAGTSALTNCLCDPNIRLVTLTVTEGGYYIDPDTNLFNASHPDIQHDMHHFASPKTVFGIMLRALWLRKQEGVAPFTVLSCDNLPGNGEVTHNALSGLASGIREIDQGWAKNVLVCPNAMVDCITPASTEAGLDFIRQSYGYEDSAPVFCEPFRQWVIEDRFVNGRPALEEVGVEFTDDVHPYEQLKLNILNAGHATIGYAGALLGLEFAWQAMQDDDIHAWFKTMLSKEVLPTLSVASGTLPKDYLSIVTERFSNPTINDPLERLCADGKNRQPKFIFPSIHRALEQGGAINGLALEVALWCRYLVDHPEPCEELATAAQASRTDSEAFVRDAGIFGGLQNCSPFKTAFAEQITRIWKEGTRAAIRSYVTSCQ